jgi:hypothetical protein
MQQQYLSSDLKRVAKVFDKEILELYSEKYLHTLVQAAQGVGVEPLMAADKPVLYEIYTDGLEDPVITLHGETVMSGDLSRMREFESLVIEVDGIYRFAQIGDRILVNSMGNHPLPEAIQTDPVAMASWIIEVA